MNRGEAIKQGDSIRRRPVQPVDGIQEIPMLLFQVLPVPDGFVVEDPVPQEAHLAHADRDGMASPMSTREVREDSAEQLRP